MQPRFRTNRNQANAAHTHRSPSQYRRALLLGLLVLVCLFYGYSTSTSNLRSADQEHHQTRIESKSQRAPSRLNLPQHGSLASANSTTIADALRCFKFGRSHDTMYYYSAEQRACLPFPNVKNKNNDYVHPPDPTLTTVIATIDHDGSGVPGTFRETAAMAESDTTKAILEKAYPSVHSRWLFESWRLWEGEVQCPNEQANREKEEMNHLTMLKKSEFVTVGGHNSSLLNSLYDLHNFCVDELEGTLIGFEEGDRPMDVGESDAFSEHTSKFKFISPERFLHSSNREAVALVLPQPNTPSSWKSIISSSLEAHHRRTANKASLPPEVLFIEDRTLVVPTTAENLDNPDHQFHRIGTFNALGRMLQARSFLVLADVVAQDPKTVVYRTRQYLRGSRPGLDVDLLPKYLVTKAEESDMLNYAKNHSQLPAHGFIGFVSDRTKHRPATVATTVNVDELRNVPDRPVEVSNFFPVIHEIAAMDAQSLLSRPLSFDSQFSPLMSTGEGGCEALRCDAENHCSSEAKAARSRCNRPYALINVALPNLQSVLGGLPYRADTQNYSVAVWNLAIRETMREAKRFRRDLWLKAHESTAQQKQPSSALLEPVIDASNSKSSSYITEWRKRLIDIVIRSPKSSLMAESLPKKANTMYQEYFLEVFAHQLESRHSAENDPTSPKPRRQLICYRRASFGHFFHREFEQNSNPPGVIGLTSTPNCELEKTLRSAYAPVWARFGMCMKGEENFASSKSKVIPELDTNRDAHPIFTMGGERKAALQAAFVKSRREIEHAIRDLEGLPRKSLLALLSYRSTNSRAKEKFMATIRSIQRTYDKRLMAHFVDSGEPALSRRIKLFSPFRSKKRVLTHWRYHVTALMHKGMGKYIDFQFEEGLAGGAFTKDDQTYSLADPLNTPRARQYYSYLTADLFLGTHGADFHGSAMAKPSAMITEFGHAGFDDLNMDFRGGFFSAFAYARHIGYLRIRISRKTVSDTKDRESWEGEHHTYMSLPDLRHSISVSVCAWLATNSVRLADEDRAGRNVSEDYSYLVPWWCRGGAKSVVKSALRQLRSRYLSNNTEPKSPPGKGKCGARWMLQPTQLKEQAEFYESRSEESGFPFDGPVCPPLQTAVGWSLDPKIKLTIPIYQTALAPSKLTLGHLRKLQNECARRVTNVVLGDSYIHVRRRVAEALQSLFEGMLFMSEEKAQLAARLMIDGAAAVAGQLGNDESAKYSMLSRKQRCGLLALNDGGGRDACLAAMIAAMLSNSTEAPNPLMSTEFLMMLNEYGLHVPVRDDLRSELQAYIVSKMAIPFMETVRDAHPATMETDDYGYGWQCSDNETKKYDI